MTSILSPSMDVVLFLLVGLGFGVHYGLDGWAGRTEVGSLKDSPRVKNFRWVLGGALFAFVADLKGLGIQGDKIHDVVAYVAGFIGSAVITIGFTALVLRFQSRQLMKSDPDSYLEQHYPPLTDYLVYGYQHYQKKFSEAMQKQKSARIAERTTFRAQFYASYAEQLSYSMAAVEAMSEVQSREVVEQAILQILRIIKGIVLEYHHRNKPQINVNVMVAYTRQNLPEEFKSRIRFNYGDSSHYSHYLAITAYADPDGKEDFVLPVENIADKPKSVKSSLPGAPLAFLKNECEVVDDTSKIEYSRSLPASLKKDLAQYFKNKSFKSFGCVSIKGRNATQLGVLVIESDKKFIFGKNGHSKPEMDQFLEPFALLMGSLITALHRLK